MVVTAPSIRWITKRRRIGARSGASLTGKSRIACKTRGDGVAAGVTRPVPFSRALKDSRMCRRGRRPSGDADRESSSSGDARPEATSLNAGAGGAATGKRVFSSSNSRWSYSGGRCMACKGILGGMWPSPDGFRGFGGSGSNSPLSGFWGFPLAGGLPFGSLGRDTSPLKGESTTALGVCLVVPARPPEESSLLSMCATTPCSRRCVLGAQGVRARVAQPAVRAPGTAGRKQAPTTNTRSARGSVAHSSSYAVDSCLPACGPGPTRERSGVEDEDPRTCSPARAASCVREPPGVRLSISAHRRQGCFA